MSENTTSIWGISFPAKLPGFKEDEVKALQKAVVPTQEAFRKNVYDSFTPSALTKVVKDNPIKAGAAALATPLVTMFGIPWLAGTNQVQKNVTAAVTTHLDALPKPISLPKLAGIVAATNGTLELGKWLYRTVTTEAPKAAKKGWRR